MSFRETVIDNCVKLINIAMSVNLIVKGTMIPIERSHLDRYLMPDLAEELALILITVLKVKVKLTLEQAIKTQKGCSGIAVLFLYFDARRGWVVKTTPRTLDPR
jgi:hypothetical protein